jgi:hypothetical protein
MCRLIVFLFFYRILFVIWKHIQLVYGDDELQKIAVTFIKRKMMKLFLFSYFLKKKKHT